MRVVALDPGKDNFAAAVLEDRNVIDVRYLEPLQSLLWDQFTEASRRFRDSYFAYISEMEPDCVIAERFMARPGGGIRKGAVGEYINIQLGIIATVNSSKGIPTHLVTPAQWKNALNSRYGHVPRKKGFKHHFPHLSVHESDALAIAVYVFEQENPEERGKLLNYIKKLRKYPYIGKVPR